MLSLHVGRMQAVLRTVTEVIARELARPTAIAPEWSKIEWSVARAVAAMQGVSPLLAERLQWRGPDVWNYFLSQQRAHTARRHERIVRLLQHIDERTCRAGIATVALKGAALHARGLYSPGERPMADIDLLARPADVPRLAVELAACGYRSSSTNWREQVFVPRRAQVVARLGEHADNPIQIEVHERIVERLPLNCRDLTHRIYPAMAKPGLNEYPSTASLMTHLLFHAAGCMVTRTLRALHLHDIALLCGSMAGEDWDELLAGDGSVAGIWWAAPPLRLVAEYYATAVPPVVTKVLARECPFALDWPLRRNTLSAVSYSQLRVAAFPGITWAQSVGEAIDYAKSRLRPATEHLAQRKAAVRSQAWAADSGWDRLSQSRRVMRWLISRPARSVTLHALAAVDGQGGVSS